MPTVSNYKSSVTAGSDANPYFRGRGAACRQRKVRQCTRRLMMGRPACRIRARAPTPLTWEMLAFHLADGRSIQDLQVPLRATPHQTIRARPTALHEGKERQRIGGK
jgi:hypothetical protein